MNELNLIEVLRTDDSGHAICSRDSAHFLHLVLGHHPFQELFCCAKSDRESEIFWKIFRRGKNMSEIQHGRGNAAVHAAGSGFQQRRRRRADSMIATKLAASVCNAAQPRN